MLTASPAPQDPQVPAAAVGSEWLVELPGFRRQFIDGTRDELTAYARQQKARLFRLTWDGARIARMMPVTLAGLG